jgi:Lrp/AsnC family transcriptional regulator
MDQFDRAILALLQEDGTLALNEIAAKVGLSPTPCWNRVRKMEESGIIARRVAVLDPGKLGLGVTIYVSIETNDHSEGWLARFAEVVRQMPEIVDVYRMSGDVDYMMRVIVPSIDAYDAFYRRLIRDIPLKNVTSRFAMEKVKSTTALPLAQSPAFRTRKANP